MRFITAVILAVALCGADAAAAQQNCVRGTDGIVRCPVPDALDIGKATQSGADFFNSLQEHRRKTDAYNALRNQYGDVAGDPAAALMLQQYRENEQRRQAQPRLLAQPSATLAEQRKVAWTKLAATKGVIAAGGDPGEAFDQFIGSDPKAAGLEPRQVPAARAAIVNNPAVLDKLMAAYRDP